MNAPKFNRAVRVSSNTLEDAQLLNKQVLPLLTGEVGSCEWLVRRLPGGRAAVRHNWRIGTDKDGIELRRGFVTELLSPSIDLKAVQGLVEKLFKSCRLIQGTFASISKAQQEDTRVLNTSLQACSIVSLVCHLDRLCALLESKDEGNAASNQYKSPLRLFTDRLRGILSGELLRDIRGNQSIREPFESFFSHLMNDRSYVYFPANQILTRGQEALPPYLEEIANAANKYGKKGIDWQTFNHQMREIEEKVALSTANGVDMSRSARSIRHITNPVQSLVERLSYYVAMAAQVRCGAAVFMPPQDFTTLALLDVQIQTNSKRQKTDLTADIVIPEGQKYLLIKANAVSGTSSILTQLGRNQIVHQSGGPIAVGTGSSIGTFRRIVSISPSNQQLWGGEGYFGNTLKQLAPYMDDAGEGDLFILDGVPVGTHHADNAAITAEILHRLISSGATVIYASKNPAVFELLETHYGLTSCSFESADNKKLTLAQNRTSTHSDGVLSDLAKFCGVSEDTLAQVERNYSALTGKQLLIPENPPASSSWQQMLWTREVERIHTWGVSENQRLSAALAYRYPKELFALSASRKMLLDIENRHVHGVGQTFRYSSQLEPDQIPLARHTLVAKLLSLSGDDRRLLEERKSAACNNYTSYVREMSTKGSKLRVSARQELDRSFTELYNELGAFEFDIELFKTQTFSEIENVDLLVMDQAFAIVKSMERFGLSMATLTDQANVLVLEQVTPIVSNGSRLGLGTPISFSMNGTPRVAEIVGANSGGKSQLLATIHLEVFSALNRLPTSGRVTSSEFTDVYVRTSNGGNRAESSIIGDLTYRSMVIAKGYPNSLVLLDEFDLGNESITASFRSAMNTELSKRGRSVVSVTHARAGLDKEQQSGAVAVWQANAEFDATAARWVSDYSFSPCATPEQVDSHGFDIAMKFLPVDVVDGARRLRSLLPS